MKKISNIKAAVSKVILFAVMIIGTVILPNMGYAQPDPGGNPDGNPPVSVPFDKGMSIALIAAGIILAVVVFKKLKSPLVKN